MKKPHPTSMRGDVPRYFFDDSLIAHQQRLVRRWLPAEVWPEPVLQADRPWETRGLVLYGTVLRAPEGGFRMYYSNFHPKEPRRLFLATSRDGLCWAKPDLGLVEYEGSRRNNILYSTPRSMDSPSVMHDPQDRERPYKLIAFQTEKSNIYGTAFGLYASFSKDGIRWSDAKGPVLRAGDRTSLMSTRHKGRFVVYTRHVDMWAHSACRAIYRSESRDFAHWSEPELVLSPDLADEPDVEFYGMQVFERHGWLFGLLEYWRSDIDVIAVHLVLSRDGKDWIRPAPCRPFIGPAYDWNRAWSTCASNGPIILNEQMVFYFGGRHVAHGFDSARQHGVIGYASLPLDRFCAIEATTGGRLDTVPFRWPGGELVLNADTRESFVSHPGNLSGEIAIEVLDAHGKPLPQWSGKRRALFQGNTHCRAAVHDGAVRWPGKRGLDALRGRNVRLRFHLTHARLFTFEARPLPS